MISYLIKGDSTVIFILDILIFYNRFRNNSSKSDMNEFNRGNFAVDSTKVLTTFY